MRTWPSLLLLLIPASVAAQAVQPGGWEVRSTAVDLTIPGAPSFLLRMMKGRSKSERKCLDQHAADTGVAALLAPDPKAQCRVDTQRIADGRFAQALTCPQKSGPSLQIKRVGTYDASGFAGRLEMAGQTPKGAMRIILDQKVARVGASCRG